MVVRGDPLRRGDTFLPWPHNGRPLGDCALPQGAVLYLMTGTWTCSQSDGLSRDELAGLCGKHAGRGNGPARRMF